MSGSVEVRELIVSVGIALGRLPITDCGTTDLNGDDRVEISELLVAVESLLTQCGTIDIRTPTPRPTPTPTGTPSMLLVRGRCKQPGAEGLTSCVDGSSLRALRCDDASRCLHQGDSQSLLAETAVNAAGGFELDVTIAPDTAIVLEVSIDASTTYRVLVFGSISFFGSGAGGLQREVVIGPASEAAVRLIAERGLEKFTPQGIQDVVDAVESANADTDFANSNPAAAADLATTVARQEANVLDAIEAGIKPIIPLRHGVGSFEAISPISDTDIFSFTLTSPSRVVLQATEIPISDDEDGFFPPDDPRNPCLILQFDLLDPESVIRQTCHSSRPLMDLVVEEPGEYFVRVSDRDNNTTLNYVLMLPAIRDIDAVELVTDELFAASISPVGELDFYRFTVSQRTLVVLQVTEEGQNCDEDGFFPPDDPRNPCVAILADPLDRAGSVAATCHCARARLEVAVDPGTYFVEVGDRDYNTTLNYEILLQLIR